MARYKVVKAAAVVKLAGGGERYVYRGSVFDDAPVADGSIEHLLAVGVIAKVDEPAGDAKADEPAKRGPGRPPKGD